VATLAVAATAAAVLPGAAQAASLTAPRITTPVNATKGDINPGRLYLAPSLAIDPANPLHVAAAMTELRTKTCFFMRSTDGGQTWVRPQSSPVPPSYPFCNTNNRGSYEAQIAFGRSGNLYMAFPGWDTQDAGTKGNTSLIVSHSSDFGDTWTPVVAVDNRGKSGLDAQGIRPVGSIAVDAKSGSDDIVYVTYASRQTNAAAPNAAPNIPTVVVSTDGGKHYGAPFNLAPSAFNSDQIRSRHDHPVVVAAHHRRGRLPRRDAQPGGELRRLPARRGDRQQRQRLRGVAVGHRQHHARPADRPVRLEVG
jgi:hypothetical protein